jgi:hypothetical protein
VIGVVTKNPPLMIAESCMQNASVDERIEVRRVPD